MRRYLLMTLALALCPHSLTAEATEPDSLTDVRVIVPTAEPTRSERRLDGTHRLVSLRYPAVTEGIDMFSASLPGLAGFLQADVRLPETRFVAEERSIAVSYDDALLVLLTGNKALLTPSDMQKRSLGAYLKQGGLLYGEDVRSDEFWNSRLDVGRSGTPFDRMFKALIADPLVLGHAGRNWRPVRKDHALYSAYFTFDGPPLSGIAGGRTSEPRVTNLEMLEVRGRVAVIFSDLNISFAWSSPDAMGRPQAFQFGTNLVVFALAQYATVGAGVSGQER